MELLSSLEASSASDASLSGLPVSRHTELRLHVRVDDKSRSHCNASKSEPLQRPWVMPIGAINLRGYLLASNAASRSEMSSYAYRRGSIFPPRARHNR